VPQSHVSEIHFNIIHPSTPGYTYITNTYISAGKEAPTGKCAL
jgi:hypothetical protein